MPMTYDCNLCQSGSGGAGGSTSSGSSGCSVAPTHGGSPAAGAVLLIGTLLSTARRRRKSIG